MNTRFHKLLALAAVASLAACGGGGANAGVTPSGPPNPILPPAQAGLTSRIVGVGDSLTAGTQSNGTMGISYTGNPVSALPGGLVPATQPNGFFALLVEQATGMTPAQMADPATSVLPLIASPGNGSQFVVTQPPLPFAATHASCDTFNQSNYALSALSTYRANPNATTLDVGVPGITAHEALTMINPLTGPPPGPVGNPPSCPGFAAIPGDPTSGGLQSLLNSESSLFYPILGGFAKSVQPLTEVNAAVALRPSLATVWLGANDLLKFIFSAGKSPSDTPTQMEADIATTIQKLQGVGAKVVVANLPDVLSTPQFFKGGATLQATLTAFLVRIGLPAQAAQVSATSATSYITTTYGVGSGGYLTETGMLASLEQCFEAALGNNLNCKPLLDPSGTGSGLGGAYLTDAFAAQVQGLNDAYNAAIGSAAAATKAPLVDIHGTFAQIAAAGGIPVNPPKCCSFAFGGGIFSFDGLHPSNTGYAVVANAFIQTIDTAYGATIPPVNVTAVYNGTAPYGPLPDPYAQH